MDGAGRRRNTKKVQKKISMEALRKISRAGVRELVPYRCGV